MKRLLYLIIIISMTLMLVGCGIPNDISTPEDARGRIIGGLAGTPSIRLADEMGIGVPFYSATEMMVELRAGNIDCAIMESTTAAALVANTSGVRILFDPLIVHELRFAIPMENTRLLDAVNLALDELSRNGTLRGLTNRYFSRGNFRYESPPDIVRRGTLTIALPPDSPPFSFLNDEGRFTGMDVDVAVAVSDILGVELDPIQHDAADLATAVWHGRADLALGWLPEEGEGLVSTSEPYARATHVVIVRR